MASFPTLTNPDALPPTIRAELEALLAQFAGYLQSEHTASGEHSDVHAEDVTADSARVNGPLTLASSDDEHPESVYQLVASDDDPGGFIAASSHRLALVDAKTTNGKSKGSSGAAVSGAVTVIQIYQGGLGSGLATYTFVMTDAEIIAEAFDADTVIAAESLKAQGKILASGVSSDVTIAGATQDNYTGLAGNVSYARLGSGTTNVTFTGFTGGESGKLVIVHNAGTFNVSFAHEGAGSTAANRLLTSTGATVTITPRQSALLRYDAADSRWILLWTT